MRDLLFKNLTSEDKRKRMISSFEIVDNEGIRSVIRRHFVYILKEIKDNNMEKPLPYLYVLKERDRKGQKEKFFCRLKGSIFAICNKRLFLIVFMHSLKIELGSIPENLVKYHKEE